MRIRLRAPEDEQQLPPLSSSTTTATMTMTTTTTPPRTPTTPRLPQLDVRSPEFIEQRLENLKRRPTWRTFLDQYVQDHPEDDDEDDGSNNAASRVGQHSAHNHATTDRGADEAGAEPTSEPRADAPGFVRHLVCAVIVVLLTPVWIVLFPFLRHKGDGFWPLESPSLWALYRRSLALLVSVAFGFALMYYTLCHELPEWDTHARDVLQVGVEDAVEAAQACREAVRGQQGTLIRELCAPVAIDVVTLQLLLWLVLRAHRRWARYVLVGVAAMQFFDVPGTVNEAIQPHPQITYVDPNYALLDEELVVALGGEHLQPGGTVAWVAYWGCASTAPVHSCEPQFPAVFERGVVSVTFTTIDHFIPCYRNPPNPLKAEDFRCFEDIRLRVKDKYSIPGWSKASRPVIDSVDSTSARTTAGTAPPKVDNREPEAPETGGSVYRKLHMETRVHRADGHSRVASVVVDAGGDVGPPMAS